MSVMAEPQRGRERLGQAAPYEQAGVPAAKSPEIGLWVAVLKQQIDDATEGLGRERDEARAWLLSGSPDFLEVVDHAGLDPEAVFDRVVRLAQRGWLTAQQWAELMGR
jgi:hypothetical protein